MTKKKQKTIQLPKDFLFGAASSSHQVEGQNIYNDWWFWEQKNKLPKSGVAADHYQKYEEDFALAKSIGLNAIRISIEWSRIEPVCGKIDRDAIEHYISVLKALKREKLVSVVTLHHYTLPVWFAEKGGFTKKHNLPYFARFAKIAAKELGNDVDFWITINEPEIFTSMTALKGLWPPFSKSPLAAFKLFFYLGSAHKLAFQEIKKVLPKAQIGIAKNNIYYEAYKPHSWLDQAAVSLSTWFRNYIFLDKIERQLDFIGLNYYFYNCLNVSLTKIQQQKLPGNTSDMGWHIYPKGIYYLVKDLAKRYDKPIYVTENGLADSKDKMRAEFIKQHLAWLAKAKNEGANIKGYFYWSLTDTYEWLDGFKPKFGLVKINKNLTRTVRKSATVYKEIQ